jgi:hypothetical protein
MRNLKEYSKHWKADKPRLIWDFLRRQVFDAYTFAVNLIKSATQSIVLIDNYIDESFLRC